MAVSVVSHGHDHLLPGLLRQLASTSQGAVARVILTHNAPGSRALQVPAGLPFEVVQRVNPQPLGFGANHNRAFAEAGADCFCVLNPDVGDMQPGIWQALLQAASAPGVGCAYPQLLNPDGSPQDQRRAALTPWALARRRLLRRAEARADWVSAAFWLLPCGVYRQTGGFDERFFMYCEDAEMCLRLQLQGWRLQQVPLTAVHQAQRSSHRDLRHLMWHLSSLVRLWCSATLWRYVCRRRGGSGA